HLRRGHHGRPAADLLLQPPARGGPALARGDPARGGEAGAAGDDDGADGDLRPAAGRRLDAHRRPDAAAAGHRGRRRPDLDLVRAALPEAGALQLLRPPRADPAVRRPGPLTGTALTTPVAVVYIRPGWNVPRPRPSRFPACRGGLRPRVWPCSAGLSPA